ncbi:hypothetical protein EYZ11_010425 [Aspergillus tanneri]|uniref:Uncharacterized protein n=1 Tax=Aspergillus tanneri TaxID=1220188 RepID=A0A4S3J5E0_9EURO|nr:hypothetical protein EYZ11_010425 [Aspergillus tanneri]
MNITQVNTMILDSWLAFFGRVWAVVLWGLRGDRIGIVFASSLGTEAALAGSPRGDTSYVPTDTIDTIASGLFF